MRVLSGGFVNWFMGSCRVLMGFIEGLYGLGEDCSRGVITQRLQYSLIKEDSYTRDPLRYFPQLKDIGVSGQIPP